MTKTCLCQNNGQNVGNYGSRFPAWDTKKHKSGHVLTKLENSLRVQVTGWDITNHPSIDGSGSKLNTSTFPLVDNIRQKRRIWLTHQFKRLASPRSVPQTKELLECNFPIFSRSSLIAFRSSSMKETLRNHGGK